jgi:hypothetical protein
VPVLPTCLALILCDDVVSHPDTGKVDLLGVFWSRRAPSFPRSTGPFAIWISLVNGAGLVRMRLWIELLADRLDEEPIVEIPFGMAFPNPREIRNHVCRIDDLHLEVPGHYRVNLAAGRSTLVQAYFIAVEAES